MRTDFGPPRHVTSNGQPSFEIAREVLRACSELAECKNEDIEKVVWRAVSEIEHVELAGWFFITESGELTDVFRSTPNPISLCPAFSSGLQRLPWCLAQLNDGKAVLIDDVDELPPFAEVDRQSFRDAEVRSVALLPSNSASAGRTVLILLSISSDTNWSDAISEQCALLETMFSIAYRRLPAQERSQTVMGYFDQFFGSSTHGMALVNNEGQIVSANKSLRRALGYSEDELRKMKCDELIDPAIRSDNASLRECLSDPALEDQQFERILLCKDQSSMLAGITINLVRRHPSDDFYALLAIKDLTEQRSAEGELSRRRTEVEVLASQLIQSQENERKRLSRELHDDLGQGLSLAASEAALLASQYSNTGSISVDRLDALHNDLDALCSNIHQISHDLHSYKLQHLGLRAALKDLCRRLSQDAFRVEFHCDELEEPVSKDVALCLYRVAQESLNNALKHARTSVVAVTITKLQDRFYMTIQDCGVGFVDNKSSQGLGLISMSERLKLVNGQFKVHSIPGRGTEVWVEAPDQRVAAHLPPYREYTYPQIFAS